MLEAGEVSVIDRLPERLALARDYCGATVIDYSDGKSIVKALRDLTGGAGPDSCIDAVGMEAHGTDMAALYDKADHL